MGILGCGKWRGFLLSLALIGGNLQASSAKAISKEVLHGKLTIQSLVSERLYRSVVLHSFSCILGLRLVFHDCLVIRV